MAFILLAGRVALPFDSLKENGREWDGMIHFKYIINNLMATRSKSFLLMRLF